MAGRGRSTFLLLLAWGAQAGAPAVGAAGEGAVFSATASPGTVDYVAVARPRGFPRSYAAIAANEGAAARPAPIDLDAPPDAFVLPPPGAPAPGAPVEVVDRWRLVEALGVRENLLNPYAQNTLKADRPIYGRDWFLELGLESRTAFESSDRPITPTSRRRALRRGAGTPSTRRGTYTRQAVLASLALLRGDTVFRPPDWKLRASAELHYQSGLPPGQRVLAGEPQGARRSQRGVGLRELYAERILRTKSERYDFDSVRVGLQPFVSDFRCFLFCDVQPGIRLFGNYADNRFAYNAAWFRRTERDPASGRTELELQRDDVFAVNLYAEDFPTLGFQLQGTAIYTRGRERGRSLALDMPGAPRRRFRNDADSRRTRAQERDVVYFGVSGDGHFDRLNLTFSAYAATGSQRGDPLVARSQKVRAAFGALETSIDFDWYRLGLHALYASGDADPFDDRAEGFSALREDARLGGLEDGFLYREPIPLGPGPDGAVLAGGLVPSLRISRNPTAGGFIQPGIRALGLSGRFDILPELRLSLHYRPLFINNITLRASLAALRPASGLRDLLGPRSDDTLYATRVELVLRY
jgi:hypothetical protein